MKTKKFKLNILDLAIFVAVICAFAVLFFRDTINEFLTKPEIVTYQVNISVDGAGNVENALPAAGKSVYFEAEDAEGERIEMTLASVEAEPNPVAASSHAEAVVVFKGYQRFGRYYTENGERIYNNSDCIFYYGDTPVECSVYSIVEIDG